jgi:hypothetical protein
MEIAKARKFKTNNYQIIKECVEAFKKLPNHVQRIQKQYWCVQEYAGLLQMHEIGFIDLNNDKFIMRNLMPVYLIDIDSRLKNRADIKP